MTTSTSLNPNWQAEAEAEADPESLHEAPRPPSSREKEAPGFLDLKRTKTLRLVAEVGILLIAAISGVLARLGLIAVADCEQYLLQGQAIKR